MHAHANTQTLNREYFHLDSGHSPLPKPDRGLGQTGCNNISAHPGKKVDIYIINQIISNQKYQNNKLDYFTIKLLRPFQLRLVCVLLSMTALCLPLSLSDSPNYNKPPKYEVLIHQCKLLTLLTIKNSNCSNQSGLPIQSDIAQ